MKKVIFLFLGWLLLLIGVNKLSPLFLTDRISYELPGVAAKFTIAPLMNFDGRNYLDVVKNGYFAKSGHNLKVFFPVYPLFIRIFLLNGLVNPVYTGILISLLSCLGSLLIFNKMFGFKATLLLFAFPTSFFFAAYYTESLFLLLTLLFFFFLNKKNYPLASLFAAFASGTRIQGLILMPILLYEILKGKETKRFLWTVFVAPLGFIFYFLYSGFSIFSGQGDWNRQIGLLGPFRALSDSITHIFQGPLSSYDSTFVYPVIVLEFLIFLFAVFVIIKMYKKVEASYFWYSVMSLIIILLGGSLASSPRYLLVVFPIFVYLSKELKGLYYVYLVMSVLLLIFFGSLFLRGYWVA